MAGPVPSRDEIVGRMITLSDALVAIAMTLLVLSIDVPDVPDSDLGGALEDLWPSFFSWVLSFVIIAVLWLSQHRSLVSLETAGGRVIAVNFLFLASISVIPFTSQLLAEYGSVGVATAIYAGNIALAASSLYGLDWLAEHGGHTMAGSDPQRPLADAIPALVFTLSIPVALFLAPEAAQYSWISILVLRPLALRFERSR